MCVKDSMIHTMVALDTGKEEDEMNRYTTNYIIHALVSHLRCSFYHDETSRDTR